MVYYLQFPAIVYICDLGEEVLPTDVQQGYDPQVDTIRKSAAGLQERNVELETPRLCEIQASQQGRLFNEEGRSTCLEAVEFHDLVHRPSVVAFHRMHGFESPRHL